MTEENIEKEAPKPITLAFPLKTKNVSDGFKEHKARNSATPGTDFPCGYGTVVRAAHAGKVVVADNNPDGSGGRVVEIVKGKVHTYYMHFSKVTVKVGDTVKAGQTIGMAGGSGFGKDRHYGTHLHFSYKFNGTLVDPMKHLK